MSSVNKATLIGRVGQDPDIRTLQTGVKVANFSIATSEKFKNSNGEKVEQTEWHRIVLWRGLAEVAEKYVKKGDLLYIEGKIHTRSYQDKDEYTKYVTEITGDNMVMLGGGKRREEPSAPEPPASEPGQEQPADDLPFIITIFLAVGTLLPCLF